MTKLFFVQFVTKQDGFCWTDRVWNPVNIDVPTHIHTS